MSKNKKTTFNQPDISLKLASMLKSDMNDLTKQGSKGLHEEKMFVIKTHIQNKTSYLFGVYPRFGEKWSSHFML